MKVEEWWCVCRQHAPSCANLAKHPSRCRDHAEDRAKKSRILDSSSTRSRRDAKNAPRRAPGRQGTRRHDLKEGGSQ
jgi:hypothetical protein